jgi:hypothetical protein
MFLLKHHFEYTRPPVAGKEKVRREAREIDPWYVTGLVEGEGCFTYSRSGNRLALYFAVKLTRADDQLLQRLQNFFRGAGTIYRVRPRAAAGRAGFTKAASYYRVCRKDELPRIVAHFDVYPLSGAKSASYRIWRMMVLLKLEFPKTSHERLEVFAKQLSATSPRNGIWDATDEDAGPYRPKIDG